MPDTYVYHNMSVIVRNKKACIGHTEGLYETFTDISSIMAPSCYLDMTLLNSINRPKTLWHTQNFIWLKETSNGWHFFQREYSASQLTFSHGNKNGEQREIRLWLSYLFNFDQAEFNTEVWIIFLANLYYIVWLFLVTWNSNKWITDLSQRGTGGQVAYCKSFENSPNTWRFSLSIPGYSVRIY